MAEFSFGRYQVGEHNYWLTTGEVTGNEALLAVTDSENDIHYVSEELAETEELPTAAVPDGYGMPDRIVTGIDVSVMDEISRYIIEKDQRKLELSLTRLGDEILGPDSRRKRPETEDQRKARKRMQLYDHEKAPEDFM